MTKQYESLFAQFSAMNNEEQIQKIREIRHRRSIERPASAKKRIVKEEKQKRGKATKLRTLLGKMTPEQIAQLKMELDSKGSDDGDDS